MHENVKEHLCHLTGVMDAELPFTYSTGLIKNDWPELILTGMHMKQGAMVIMTIVDMLNNGLVIKHGKEIILWDTCPITFVKVSQKSKNERMGITSEYLGGKPFDAYQIVWSDRNSKFPWDSGFEEEFRQNLPLLGEF